MQTFSKTAPNFSCSGASCLGLAEPWLSMSEDRSEQVGPKLSPLASCPLTTYESGHCLTQLFVNCDWFNSIPQWQRTKFWRPINHYSHWKNTLVWWYYLRRDSAWFCAVWQESGMNLFWIHSINDAGKLQKLLPFESYEGKCKGQLASNIGFKIWFALF